MITLALATLLLSQSGSHTTHESTDTYDCGTLSLYTLARLVGKPTELPAIERALPPAQAPHSMEQLQSAGRSLGLELDGIQLQRDRPLDQPALVFVRNGNVGHFFVIRPTGGNGSLVDVLDSADDRPYSIDLERLRARPDWTGYALAPARPHWPALTFAIVGLAILAVVGIRRWRGSL
jgi:ABC-type bacteriocin/lantibiotic exporter with double-glycine peptidase domain